jgi:hypothetical protein
LAPIPHKAQLPTIVSEFLRYYRTTRTSKINIYRGVFGATLDNKESLYKSKERKPRKPCLCGDIHFWGQCPYIDKINKPKGFLEDPEKAKKIAEFEAKDKEGILNQIRAKNRRFKKVKKRQESKLEENNDSDSITINAGDLLTQASPPSSPHGAFATFSSAFSPRLGYPLLHS